MVREPNAAQAQLDAAIERSWTRLRELRELSLSAGRDDVAWRATEEFATVLEELRVTGEELSVQNEELAEAMKQLARERQRFRDLFEQAPDAYVVTDHIGIILTCNSAAVRLFGVESSRLRGKPLDLYLPRARAHARHTWRSSDAGTQPRPDTTEWVTTARTRGGGRVPVGVRFARVQRGDEEAVRWLLRDLTERQRAEEHARKLVQEQAAREAAEEAEQHARFLADVSYAFVSSVDIDATLADVARRVAHFVADVCIIDIVSGGQHVRRVAAHRAAEHAAVVESLASRRLDPAASRTQPAHASQLKRPYTVPAAQTPDQLGVVEKDAELLWSLGMRSVVVVPLPAPRSDHGAMTLAAVTNIVPKLTLIRELAERTSTALERARLFAELHDANATLRVREAEAQQQRLEAEMARAALEQARGELEVRIAERTAELARANEALSAEIAERARHAEARSELLRQLASAEEDERRRIARELHDEMGQLVTALQLGLKSLELDPDAVNTRARIVELERLADRIARATQHLALELRPPALDRLGLVPALQAHLEEWSKRTSIACDFHTVGLTGERLTADVETVLYRVVQEGLTNILKHASADRVSLIVERRQGYVCAILEDNGQGFDVDAVFTSPAKAQRLGLHGMRERVALLGGTLEIESSRRTGTTLFVRVPSAS